MAEAFKWIKRLKSEEKEGLFRYYLFKSKISRDTRVGSHWGGQEFIRDA